MSIVSTRHAIRPFTAGDKALSGQRLVKLQWKSSKKGKQAEFPNHAVSLPAFEDKDIISAVGNGMFLDMLKESIYGNQKELIKSLFVESGGTLKEVGTEDVSLDQIHNYFLAQSSAENSFTKDALGKWFDAEIAENLTMSVMIKLSVEDEDNELVVKTVKLIKSILLMATMEDYEPQGKQLKAFQAVVEVDTGDSWIGKKLAGMVEKWEKIGEVDYLDVLVKLGR